MTEGVGIDIVSNERIRNLYERFGEKFLRKIFTENEINYCFNYSDPIPHLAGRFAAKEAVIKALGKPEGLTLKNIEIINNKKGMPQVLLRKRLDENFNFLITISHEKTHTVAFAILMRT
ncbi:MAG: holo-ACP synthase [Thermodesulfovibrio sp.]|nr:holo-ACP synthase [Thermodesulfovibrio sp.]